MMVSPVHTRPCQICVFDIPGLVEAVGSGDAILLSVHCSSHVIEMKLRRTRPTKSLEGS